MIFVLNVVKFSENLKEKKGFSMYSNKISDMLDLEKRTLEQQKKAESALKEPKLFADLLDGLFSKNSAFRYENFKVVYFISEDHPEALYPKWDLFENMLKSENAASIFQAIHILANLAKVDRESKFERIFSSFYDILNGGELIPASHVAYVSDKIAKAKPNLVDRITERLLNLDNATYKHKELVQANALKSFSGFFDRISDKEKVISLAEDLQKSKSSKAKKEAAAFLKKWNVK
jgi:hypothetical protein